MLKRVSKFAQCELLKDTLGDDYVNDDQAIGYLSASAKLDTVGRDAARSALSNSGNQSGGRGKIIDLNTIFHMKP